MTPRNLSNIIATYKAISKEMVFACQALETSLLTLTDLPKIDFQNTFQVIQYTSISPIYLTRGGYLHSAFGSLRGMSFNGYYWTYIAYSSELYAYNAYFNSIDISPSSNNHRWFGFAVQKNLDKKNVKHLLICYISNSWR